MIGMEQAIKSTRDKKVSAEVKAWIDSDILLDFPYEIPRKSVEEPKQASPAPEGFQIFESPESGQVRVVTGEDGEPRFVGKDVATVLGYKNTSEAIQDHCKYSRILKGSDSRHLTNSPRGITIIPESDVYRLIMRSRLPQAEDFQDWVTTDILLSIHKQGAYAIENPIKQGETPDPKPVPEGFRVFESEQFWPVRVVIRPGGEPWFVAKDVAEVLGYGDTAQAIRNHCRGGGHFAPSLQKVECKSAKSSLKATSIASSCGPRCPRQKTSRIGILRDRPSHPSANSGDRLTTPH